MKRTFLVEIEDAADNPIGVYDVLAALNQTFAIPCERIKAADITAVHAKERELVGAAIAYAKARAEYDADDSSGSDFAMVGMLVDAQGVMELKARELRALMEGKA